MVLLAYIKNKVMEPCKICHRYSYVHIRSLRGLLRRLCDQIGVSKQSRPPADEPSARGEHSAPSGSMIGSYHATLAISCFSVSIPCAQTEVGFDHAFVHLVGSDRYSNEKLAALNSANPRSFGSWRAGHARLTSFQQGTELGQSLG